MKLTAFLLLVICLHVTAHTVGQTVTLKVKDAPMRQVFREIQRQTGLDFLVDEAILDKTGRVTLDVRNMPVSDVLNICLRNEPLSFTIAEGRIMVKATPPSLNDSPPPTDIHGRVTDSLGNPLAGASVTVKGTKQVAVTDEKGEFVLKGVDREATIIVSNVGYEPQAIRIGDRSVFNLVLKQKIGQLDETRVIAYGTTTQRFSVGSVSKVSSEDIAEQPVLDPLGALEGRVPGLLVNSTSGVPGSSYTIQIRGQNTINTNRAFPAPMDNPLFIVDGVPFTTQNSNLNQYTSLAAPGSADAIYDNSYGGISPFNLINPSDIESIEVLRDADATAIYGSRGANGVILITTKKGKAGKTSFSANAWTGASVVTRTVPMMNISQYLNVRNEAFNNDGTTPNTSNAPDLLVFDTTQNTNWAHYFTGGTAHTTDLNASLSGGSVNTQFFIGTGYHNESYIYPGNFGYDRASVNANFHHSSTDQRLTIDFSSNYAYDQNNSSGSGNVVTAFNLPPDYPSLFNPDGSINWIYKGFALSSNPMSYIKMAYMMQDYNLISHFQIGYQVIPGLIVRSSFGYNTLNSQETSEEPIASQNPTTNPTANTQFGTNNFQTWIIEPQAEYKKNIFGGRIDALIGSTFQQNINKSTSINADGYTNDALLGSIAAAASTTATDGYALYKYDAIFGRFNYVWSNKFIIDFTGRRDGSSRFGPGRQFGNFGAAGGGWIFTQEKWFNKMLPAMSYGKLHVSYGTTGNDNIGNYQYIENWQPSSPAYQGSTGYIPSNLSQPNFGWSTTKKLEGGLELGLLKDRVLVSGTWFQDRCGNQLVSYALPTQTGFSSVTENFPAVVQNTGWELQLSAAIIKTNEFTWNILANLTLPKNKLLAYPGLAASSYQSTYVVGKSLSVIQAYRFAGVNDTTGVFQFYSAKGGPTYSPSFTQDRVIAGNLDPKYYGGFKNTFNYKGLQLDIFFQFEKQLATNYLFSLYGGLQPGNYSVNLPTAIAGQEWKQPSDMTNIQKYTTGSNSMVNNGASNFYNSNGVYSDDSYLRLKTLSLSYTVNSKLLGKAKLAACRVFINAQNLITITDYKVADPETHSLYSLPPLRTVVAGIQFTF